MSGNIAMSLRAAPLAPNFQSNYRGGRSSTNGQALRRLNTADGVNRQRGSSMARVPLDMIVSAGLAVAATVSTLLGVRPKVHFPRG